MPNEYTGRGDPRRTLELLWGIRRQPTRGPKPGLSVERIVEAAIQLADREGLDGLSMRRVAESLGVGAMSLYTYVPAKGELIDLMVDTTLGEQAAELADVTGDAGQGWRAGLERLARIEFAVFERHPWLAHVASSRSVLGPHETKALEHSLRIVSGIGLTAREMVAVVDAVTMYVTGVARRAVEIAEAPTRTGMTDDEWWLEREPLMAEVYDWERYPTVVEVSKGGGFDEPEGSVSYLMQFLVDDFEFGLQRMLDGIEAFLAARSTMES